MYEKVIVNALSTPHELSMVYLANDLVYHSQRFSFTSPASPLPPITIGSPYFTPILDPPVPGYPLDSVHGDPLPSDATHLYQLRNLNTGACATIRVDYNCSTGVADIVENTTQCRFE